MSAYTLLNNYNTVAALPPATIVRPVPVSERSSLAIATGNLMDPTLAISPPNQQAFQLVVTGTGAVSASAQIYGATDNKNWTAIGAPITASGANKGTSGAAGTVGYAFFGALLTSITGTGAVAN